MINKNVLKVYGKNTAYSSKCHFKAADLRRSQTFYLILIPLAISIINLSNILPFEIAVTILNIISLFSSILLLIFYATDGQNNPIKNKMIAEKYLKLHNDIHHVYNNDNITDEEISSLKNRMNRLNESEKPFISKWAKKCAAKSIEKKGEMHIWWK